MSVEQAAQTLRRIPPSLAGEALTELDDDIKSELLQQFSEQELAQFFSQLEHSDATDLMSELDDAIQRTVLDQLPDDVSCPVQSLLQYGEDTAGGIMSDRFITLGMHETVESCQRLLRSDGRFQNEDISYLYVVYHKQRLMGIVSFRDLVFSSSQNQVSDIMRESVAALRVNDDQEVISRQFAHYHYLGLPVLDDEDRVV